MMPLVDSVAEDKQEYFVPIFSINERVAVLKNLNQLTPYKITRALDELKYGFEHLNPAEQYLYLIAQAYLLQDPKDSEIKVNYLSQARLLETNMNNDQLHFLPFLTLYPMLSESYAHLGLYKEAYEAKKTYITRYETYLKTSRKKHIFELEEKYETQRKKDINTLLNDQTTLKSLEIEKSLTYEVNQRRNIYIVAFLLSIFAILFIRMFFINKRFKKLSQEDILTGIKNRKTLFKEGRNAINQSIESDLNLCLLAIKIDGFKRLNDAHGDFIGDELLKKVASLGTEVMRMRDVFGRLEDATFVAILPEATKDEAKAIAEHLRDKVEAFNFDYVGIEEHLEVNIGIVELSPSVNNIELLLNMATQVLHDIRDTEGDKVRIYQQGS